jgi:hypothetical protein
MRTCAAARNPLERAPSMTAHLHHQRLAALFAAALLLFNFPLLALWDRELTVFGVPLFPAALFFVWGVLIALLAWSMERTQR